MRIVGLFIVLYITLSLPVSRIYWTSRIFPCFVVIVFSVGALLLGRSSIPTMVRAVFSGKATDEELAAASAAWERARSYAMAAGWIGALAGLLHTVQGLVSSLEGVAERGFEPTILSAGVAESLGGVMAAAGFLLFAVLLARGIFLPLQKRLEDRAGQARPGPEG